jgi:exodeoxyribonuclease (lambda-induced)
MKLDITNHPQGSLEWLQSKMGVISASNVSKVLAKKGTETRAGYISELVAQIATGEMPELNAKAMEWGKAQEGVAREAYAFTREVKVQEAGFIYGKDRRVGCSPDGLMMDQLKGLEIKCPFTSKVHVDFLAMDKIKKEYLDQVQFSLWVTGFETWDFCSFDPRFKKNMLKIHTIERDQSAMERFDNDVPEFIKEMDAVMSKLGLEWGSQWS